VILTAAEYRAACVLAGTWLLRSLPTMLLPDQPTGVRCAIYIAAQKQRLGWRATYVGRADRRPAGDVIERVAVHRRDPARRAAFERVMIVPLHDDVPSSEITRIEGAIARYFGCPRLCRAIPRKRVQNRSRQHSESPS
jgi:hypothetical protein